MFCAHFRKKKNARPFQPGKFSYAWFTAAGIAQPQQEQNRINSRIRIQIHSLFSNTLQKHPIFFPFLSLTRNPELLYSH